MQIHFHVRSCLLRVRLTACDVEEYVHLNERKQKHFFGIMLNEILAGTHHLVVKFVMTSQLSNNVNVKHNRTCFTCGRRR